MTLKPGEVLETAIWATGEEPEELAARFEADIRVKLSAMAAENSVIIGPLIMTVKKPGDARVPAVPDTVSGPDVRLLVGEAQVIADARSAQEGAFIADLDPRDRDRLRAILRRVHKAWNPGKPELSAEKCDEYINRNGPDAALAALREQVGKTVH